MLAASFSPAQAIELRVNLQRGSLALAELKQEQWPGLSLAERRLLIPHLVEYGESLMTTNERRAWLQTWSGESDEFLRAYHGVASINFLTDDPAQRQSRLIRLRAALPNATTRKIVEFHLAIEKQRAGQNASAVAFEAICTFPEQSAACRLARWLRASEAIEAASPDRESVRRLLQLGRPFLAREALRPAFFDELAAPLPHRLYRLGLPLEAALIAERMTHNESGPRIDRLRAQIPFYLAGAGDFESAFQFSRRLNAQPGPEGMIAWLDWLTLGGRYREALNLVSQVGPQGLSSSQLARHEDYWTGFRYSAEGLRLRSAMLLYLAGDVKKAAEGLELLKDMSGDFRGEPARFYARLRLAQILLRENPELAQRLAEDISYIAQENRWPVLEYHATVLDGWAHLNAGRHYKAVINFIKARGILPPALADHGAEYSRLLGLLAARNALAPRANHNDLIQEINALLARRPYNEAIYTIRDWSPVESAPDVFLREATRNMMARGARWDALNLLLTQNQRRESFFEPGDNPGGVRGFQSSALWSQEMTRFAYFDSRRFRPSEATLLAAQRGLPGDTAERLGPRSFSARAVHLFSFPVAGGRYIFQVRPGRRGPEIDALFLKTEQAISLSSVCSPGAVEGCVGGSAFLDPLRRSFPEGLPILAHYTPEYSIDWRAALAGSRGPALVHFYQPRLAASAWRVREQRLYRADRCPAPQSGLNAISQPAFEQVFTDPGLKPGGVWLWPEQVDARLSSDGRERPVYLRRFVCGNASLRLWDLDRFYSGNDLDLLIVRRRSGEAALDRAFARPFAEQGAPLLETGPNGFGADFLQQLMASADPLAFYQASAVGQDLRLILPGMPR